MQYVFVRSLSGTHICKAALDELLADLHAKVYRALPYEVGELEEIRFGAAELLAWEERAAATAKKMARQSNSPGRPSDAEPDGSAAGGGARKNCKKIDKFR